MFFPIFWMILTSFKSEADAFTFPPPLFFHPTLDQYEVALGASGYFHYLANTILITGLSTLIALLLGVPAAYKLAFYPDEAQQLHPDVGDVHPHASRPSASSSRCTSSSRPSTGSTRITG